MIKFFVTNLACGLIVFGCGKSDSKKSPTVTPTTPCSFYCEDLSESPKIISKTQNGLDSVTLEFDKPIEYLIGVNWRGAKFTSSVVGSDIEWNDVKTSAKIKIPQSLTIDKQIYPYNVLDLSQIIAADGRESRLQFIEIDVSNPSPVSASFEKSNHQLNVIFDEPFEREEAFQILVNGFDMSALTEDCDDKNCLMISGFDPDLSEGETIKLQFLGIKDKFGNSPRGLFSMDLQIVKP